MTGATDSQEKFPGLLWNVESINKKKKIGSDTAKELVTARRENNNRIAMKSKTQEEYLLFKNTSTQEMKIWNNYIAAEAQSVL